MFGFIFGLLLSEECSHFSNIKLCVVIIVFLTGSLGAGRYVPGSSSGSSTVPAADPFTGNVRFIICLASI